jgi:hypothetical protein
VSEKKKEAVNDLQIKDSYNNKCRAKNKQVGISKNAC